MTSRFQNGAKALAAAVALPILLGSSLALAQAPATPTAAPKAAAPLASATPPTPLGDLRDMSRIVVGGKVAEIFGNKVVIEDASGRALVDFGPSGDEKPLVSVGETVTVEGRFERGSIHAASLTHENGRREAMREPRGPGRGGPQDDGPRGHGRDGHGRHHGGAREDGPRGEGLRSEDGKGGGGFLGWFSGGGVDESAAAKMLTDAGYTDVTLVGQGPRHAEFRAKDVGGKEWRVAVGDNDALREREPFQPELTEDQARSAIEALGYIYDGDYEARREHVEVAAKTKKGTAVTVELNPDGSLRKERFDNLQTAEFAQLVGWSKLVVCSGSALNAR